MTREEEIRQAAIDACGDTVDWAFRIGAEWSDSHPRNGLVDIDKALKWFEENLHMYNTSECKGDRIAFVDDFKKAMEQL